MSHLNLSPGSLHSYYVAALQEKGLEYDELRSRMRQTLSPWFVTGLTDSEGAFMAYMTETGKLNFEFAISQKVINANVLWALQQFFGIGNVVWSNKTLGQTKWSVKDHASLLKLVNHFDKYPLVTSKALNYKDFRNVLIGYINKTMTTSEIREILSGMNSKRSWKDKFTSVHVQPLHPDWVVGFVAGDGCYYAEVGRQVSRGNTYPRISLSLEVGQSSHDLAVLHSLMEFFGAGFVSPKCDHTSLASVVLTREKHIFKCKNVEAIPAIMDTRPMGTTKDFDYKNWCEIHDLWKSGAHRTAEGYDRMLMLKKNMNSGRNN